MKNYFSVIALGMVLLSGAVSSASNTVNCNNGALTVLEGASSSSSGGNPVTSVTINIGDAGVLQYFRSKGFVFPATPTPPPGVRTNVAANRPSFEQYKYMFRDGSGNFWFIQPQNQGMTVIASSGSNSINWYFQTCSFR